MINLKIDRERAQMPKYIILEKEEGIAKITLNRPPVNILNIEMMREIIDLLGELAKEKDLKIVLFQGNQKAFSAGVDVGEHTADKVEEMIEVFGKLFEAINSIPVITLASVEEWLWVVAAKSPPSVI